MAKKQFKEDDQKRFQQQFQKAQNQFNQGKYTGNGTGNGTGNAQQWSPSSGSTAANGTKNAQSYQQKFQNAQQQFNQQQGQRQQQNQPADSLGNQMFQKERQLNQSKSATSTQGAGNATGGSNAYVQSANVTAAQDYLQSVKDGGYDKKWSQTLDGLVNEYMERGAFEYNADDDVQWQQAKAEGLREANTAMRNSMAQSAALSGGYGNSYAATVGNQVYQQGVADVMALAPEYYQAAYQRYKDEGDQMLQNISLAQGMDETAYGRWADEYNRASNAYESAYNRDYGQFTDQRAYDYQVNRDAINDERYNQEFAYQQQRDQVADERYADETAYNRYIDQRNYDYQAGRDAVADERYADETAYNRYIDQRNFNYQQGRDQVADNRWQQEFDTNNSHWQQEFDYSKYADERDFGYRSTQDAIANARWQQEFDADNARWAEEFNYKMDQDRIANDQWRATFDYQKDQDNNSRYIANLENRNDRLESENSSLQDRENARIQQEQDEAKAVEAAATSRAVMNFISDIGSSSSNVGNDIKQAYLDGDFGDGDAAKQKIAYLFVHYGYSEDEANKIMGWN